VPRTIKLIIRGNRGIGILSELFGIPYLLRWGRRYKRLAAPTPTHPRGITFGQGAEAALTHAAAIMIRALKPTLTHDVSLSTREPRPSPDAAGEG